MKTLSRLIRFQKKKMDEQRLFVAQVSERIDRLKAEIHQLDKEMGIEEALALSSIEASVMFPTYAAGVNLRKKKVNRYLNEVMIQLEKEQENLRLQFIELKRYEILYDSKLKQEKQEQKKKIQTHQDDIATLRHRFIHKDPIH